MLILIDHGTPAPLRRSLVGHSVATAYELGWATLKNGDLLQSWRRLGDDYRTFTLLNRGSMMLDTSTKKSQALAAWPPASLPKLAHSSTYVPSNRSAPTLLFTLWALGWAEEMETENEYVLIPRPEMFGAYGFASAI